MFFKNLAERIKKLALLVAIAAFVLCLGIAVLFLISTFRTPDPELRMAGIQGTLVFVALAVVLPMFSWPLFGLSELLKNSEKQAEAQREIKELLRQALAEGALAEDVARKLAATMPKMTAQAPAPQIPRAQIPVQAPVQAPAAPAAPAPQGEQEEQAAPVAEQPTAAQAPAAKKPTARAKKPTAENAPEPVQPDAPVKPLRKLGGNKQF